MTQTTQKNKIWLALAPWLLPCAVYGLVWLVFGVRYEVNDDAILANIASGAYGPDSQYLVYMNIAIGWLLKPLYWLVPGFNWLYGLQTLGVLAALGVVCNLLCKKLGATRGLLVGLILLMLAGVDAFYSFQYVKNSGLYLIIGFALLSEELGRWNRRTFAGIFWVVLGALVRDQMFVAVGALAAPLLLFRFIPLDGQGKKRAVTTMAALFALVGVLFGINALAYTLDDGWHAFQKYNQVRTHLSDFQLQYATPEHMAGLGYSANDLDVLKGWSFWDDQVFGAQQLEEISTTLPGNDPVRAAKETAYRLLFVLDGAPFHLFLVGASLVWLFFSRQTKSWVFPATALMFALLVFYLSLQGRYVHRVEYVLVVGTAVLGLLGCRWQEQPILHSLRSLAFCTACIACVCFPTWQTIRTDMIQYRIDRANRTGILEHITSKDHLYLADVDAVDILSGYDVLRPREKDFFSNIVEMGGWLSHAPHRIQTLAQYQVTHPYLDMVSREGVYLLDAYNVEAKRVYLDEHYSIQAEFESVASDGMFHMLQVVSES